MNSEDQKPVLHKEYPPIFGKDKSGKTRVWNATVFSLPISNKGISVIQHGIYDGKLQVDTRQYTEGKNIGKKNETTPLQQCVAEVEKKRKDKIEKEGYTETYYTASNTSTLTTETAPTTRKIFPMLANKYEPNATKKRGGILFPCFVQPKLDGLRCVVYLVDGLPVYQSRTGGIFTVLHHLDSSVVEILSRNPTLVLDGELYTQQIPFEELAGIIKKKTLTETDKQKILHIQYHVYDLVIPKLPFRERLLHMQQTISSTNLRRTPDAKWEGFEDLISAAPEKTHRVFVGRMFVVPVSTYLANSVADFREKFGEYVAQGYEGIMLRNTEGLYQENYRSNDLMKYKEFFEAEYPIVDYKEATGRDEGTVIWECETPEGRRFSVRPRGTQEARREWFCKAESLVGKQLTVIYQELSEMGVPRFPVGKAIRDGY
jgi:DNA ligase-1